VIRAAAICSWVLPAGFGLPGVYGTWYFADHDQVWSFVGFPTYGDGPFEDIGVETTVRLLAAFVLICAGEAIVGWMLWQHRSSATTLSLALLPLELVFWIGFALPFAFVIGAARTVLVVMARSAARRGQQPARR